MNESGLQKIEHSPATLRDIVQKRMRDAIIEGHFAPGERLIERPLCEQLGVSRTVIRETIRFLEAEGLVEILPNRGPIVARLSREDAKQIYEIRAMLETSAAESCAGNMSPSLAKTLRAAFSRLETASHGEESGALLRATDAFYQVIFEGADKHIAWEIVQRLTGRISRLRAITLNTHERERPGLDHMRRICDAITAGNKKAARKSVQKHLSDAAKVADDILTTLEKDA